MAKRDGAGAQEPLELGQVEARPAGSVEAAVRRAVQAAELDPRDVGAAEAAAGLARGLDLALGRRDPYAVAAIGKPLTEQLARLHLDPEARGQRREAVAADPWDQLVEDLAAELKAPGGGHDRGPAHPAT